MSANLSTAYNISFYPVFQQIMQAFVLPETPTLGLSVPERQIFIVTQVVNPPVIVKPVATSNNVNSSGSANVTNGTAFNATSSFNNGTSTFYRNITTSKLCGFPAFCSNKAYNACANTPLCACAECSTTGAGFFVFFVVLLGLACVFGNVLVMAVLKKLGLRQSFNKMKFSLAVADFLTGVQLLVVSIYNFSWTMNVTSMELDQRQLSLRGSAQATVGGIFLLLTFTSSLYHLVYMGAQRLYAIKWPMSYRLQKDFHITIGLVVVWLLALLSSTVPAWFPDVLVYTYNHNIFLFYISNAYYSSLHGTNFDTLIAIMICFNIIPYLAMTCATFVTLYSARRNIKKSKQLKHGKSANQKPVKVDSKEFEMCITVALMQLGFTMTIIPLVVINALFYGYSLTCDTASLPFLVCFYLSMSNSLVNIIVYSFRNKAFVKTAKEMLAIPICCPRKDDNIQTSYASRSTAGTQVS